MPDVEWAVESCPCFANDLTGVSLSALQISTVFRSFSEHMKRNFYFCLSSLLFYRHHALLEHFFHIICGSCTCFCVRPALVSCRHPVTKSYRRWKYCVAASVTLTGIAIANCKDRHLRCLGLLPSAQVSQGTSLLSGCCCFYLHVPQSKKNACLSGMRNLFFLKLNSLSDVASAVGIFCVAYRGLRSS